MKSLVKYLFLIGICYFICGCQESQTQQVKRAQLVGHQNLQLKKIIQEKERQIEDLKKEIENLNKKMAQQSIDFDKAHEGIMKLMETLTKDLNDCRQEKENSQTQP